MTRAYLSIIVVALALVSARAEAFSEGFKKQMTTLQEKVLIKGERFSISDAKQCWNKFDDEIIRLLGETRSEGELSRKAAAEGLIVTVRKAQEKEDIELGKIEAEFFKIDSQGKVWLVALTNDMGTFPTGTFHIYEEQNGKFVRTAGLEDVTGPWDQTKIQFSKIQIQRLGSGFGHFKFSSLHMPAHKGERANRSQIVWEYTSFLKPVAYVPEVDWHEVGGKVVDGRGEAQLIP